MTLICIAHCTVLSKVACSHPKITREDLPPGPAVPSATPGQFWANLGTNFRIDLTQTLGLRPQPNLSSTGIMGVGSQDSDTTPGRQIP